jgi:hypothetical protein
MKKTIQTCCLAALLYLGGSLKAQLSGNYTVPGSYATIASAISALNTLGVIGPVNINVAAGYTETAVTGGYTLNTVVGASSLNPVTFQKFGAGANPIVYAYVGTAAPNSAIQDGVWRFNGSDFITIDGIDITDLNTTNNATMEFGYGFFKPANINGCQNNTIKNCTITLNYINNATGSGPAVEGSRGIDMVNSAMNTHITNVTVSNATGGNSNNKFYSNLINNCNVGIALIGYAAPSPFTLADVGNDVGGVTAATGNTITNFGGGGANASAGVRTLAQYSLNVSYNVINSNNGSGLNHAGILRGIYLFTATSAGMTINNNTITVNGGGTTQQLTAIDNVAGSTAANNTITINNNVITNCTYSTATSGVFYGIWNSATPRALSISNNTFSNNSTSATSGAFYNIYNSGAVNGFINFDNNLIDLGTFNATSTSLVLSGIYNISGATGTDFSASSNTLQNVNYTGATGGTGVSNLIYNSTAQGTVNINNNNFNNISLKTTNTAYLIFNSNTTPLSNANNNIITTGFSKLSSGGSVFGYYNVGSASSGTTTQSGNNFSNITLIGSTIFYGIYNTSTTSQTKLLLNNRISNIVGGSSTMYGIWYSGGTASSAVSSNSISGISADGSIFGIYYTSTASPTLNISSNVISTFSTTGSAALYGIFSTNGSTTYIHKNKIFDFTGSDPNISIYGIYLNSGTTTGIYNNLIGDLFAPTANATNPITGIYINGGTNVGVYFNSVYLNATSTGATFGSSAVFASTNPSTEFQSNIFVNQSTANGSGITAAYRRSSTSLGSYAVSSDNNLFYAGNPSASNVLFNDGTNSLLNIFSYKSFTGGADQASISENPPFLSVIGSNANFLNINPTIATQIESGALPYPGITDDIAGTIRNVATPDIGAWEGNYTGYSPCSGAPVSNSVSANNSIICPNQSVELSLTNTYTLTGLTYQWEESTTGAAGPYTAIASATNPMLSSSPIPSTTWYQVIVTCTTGPATSTAQALQVTVNIPTLVITPPALTVCANSFVNFSVTGASTYTWNNTVISNTYAPFATGNVTYSVSGTNTTGCTSMNTVAVTTLTLPIIAITPTFVNVCAMTTVSFTASGANTYTWNNGTNGPNATFTPSAPSVYTVTGTNAEGCSSSTIVPALTQSLPSVSVTPLSVNACPNSPVNFTASGASTYTWSSGSTGSLVTITPTASGIYTVTGTGSSNTCTASRTVAIVTYSLPVLTVSPTSPSVCTGSSILLASSGANSYSWSTGSGSSSITVNPTTNTSYTANGFSNEGCVVSKTVNVFVHALPVLGITVDKDTACVGDVITFTGSGAANYTWTPGNVVSPVFTVSPGFAIGYSYLMTGADINNCVSTKSINLLAITCTGLNEVSSIQQYSSVFPNPSSGKINTVMNFEGNKEILIMNATGALMSKVVTEEKSQLIDLSNFAKGIYIVKINSNGGSAVHKIIVE